MRTTLNIEDALLDRARELTGVKEKTTLVRLGLKALIAAESARRLSALGGSEPGLDRPRRRVIHIRVPKDVIGELACGNLRNRSEILSLLSALPGAKAADHDEAMGLLTDRELHGAGLGWVDTHLLASALITGCRLWTRDKALADAARAVAVEA